MYQRSKKPGCRLRGKTLGAVDSHTLLMLKELIVSLGGHKWVLQTAMKFRRKKNNNTLSVIKSGVRNQHNQMQ